MQWNGTLTTDEHSAAQPQPKRIEEGRTEDENEDENEKICAT
jgi:hypothetical protein